MCIERKVRVFAAVVILGSLVLYYFHSEKWLFLTAFAGLNLLQSAFTGFCVPEIVFKKLEERKVNL